jgi:3-phenylpropionate/cinnamic acid dioxygenase small subunit
VLITSIAASRPRSHRAGHGGAAETVTHAPLVRPEPAMTLEHVHRIADLNARYVDAIDADRLEAWPDFFLDDGSYRITTAENVAQDLPLSIIYATSRAMLRDRVKALREANVYEGQRYRHVLGTPLIAAIDAGVVAARTNFMVARVMHSGETMLFATGCYHDRVVLDGTAFFAEKTVIIDSRQIDTLLAIPL